MTYVVTTRSHGGLKPLATEYHYSEKSANYRADILREQARRNGWAVRIVVAEVIEEQR